MAADLRGKHADVYAKAIFQKFSVKSCETRPSQTIRSASELELRRKLLHCLPCSLKRRPPLQQLQIPPQLGLPSQSLPQSQVKPELRNGQYRQARGPPTEKNIRLRILSADVFCVSASGSMSVLPGPRNIIALRLPLPVRRLNPYRSTRPLRRCRPRSHKCGPSRPASRRNPKYTCTRSESRRSARFE